VLFRVISWIAFNVTRKAIHEITRNNTNEVPNVPRYRAWDSRLFVQATVPRNTV